MRLEKSVVLQYLTDVGVTEKLILTSRNIVKKSAHKYEVKMNYSRRKRVIAHIPGPEITFLVGTPSSNNWFTAFEVT